MRAEEALRLKTGERVVTKSCRDRLLTVKEVTLDPYTKPGTGPIVWVITPEGRVDFFNYRMLLKPDPMIVELLEEVDRAASAPFKL